MGIRFQLPNQHGEADPSTQPLPKEVDQMLAELQEKKMRLTVGQMEICIFVSSSPNFFVFGWESFFWMGNFLNIWILHFGIFASFFFRKILTLGVNMAGEQASMFVFGVFLSALGFCGRKTSSTKNIPLKIPIGTMRWDPEVDSAKDKDSQPGLKKSHES